MRNRVEKKENFRKYLTASERMEVDMILKNSYERADMLAVRGVTSYGIGVMQDRVRQDHKRMDDLIILAKARHMALEMRKRDRVAELVSRKDEMSLELRNRVRERLDSGDLSQDDLDAWIRSAR